MREMAKTMFEVEVSRAMGLPGKINLPNSQDMEMQALVQQNEGNRLRREIMNDTIETAKAAVIDLPDDDPDIRSLGLAGVDRDTLLESNPDAWLALVNRKNMPLTRGNLSRYAKVTDTDTASAGPAFQQKQAEEQAKVVSTQAGFISDAEKVAKAAPAAQEQAKAAIKASLETLGADTDFFDSDFDTERGALGLMDAADTLLRQAGPAYKGVAARGLIDAIKGDVEDYLEDADAINGEVIVNDRPSFYVSATLLRLAKERGVNVGDQMKEMGLGKFIGIEGNSFKDFMAREARVRGMELPDFRATLGL
jgi:hypothetical protein